MPLITLYAISLIAAASLLMLLPRRCAAYAFHFRRLRYFAAAMLFRRHTLIRFLIALPFPLH